MSGRTFALTPRTSRVDHVLLAGADPCDDATDAPAGGTGVRFDRPWVPSEAGRGAGR